MTLELHDPVINFTFLLFAQNLLEVLFVVRHLVGINQNVSVELIVIIIFELKGSSVVHIHVNLFLNQAILVSNFMLVYLLYFGTFLEKMRRLNDGVNKELLVVSDGQDSHVVSLYILWIFHGLDVWISVALVNAMANLFTAHAFQILQLPLPVLLLLGLILLVVIFFGLVLRVLAPWSIQTLLSAAPPHLSVKLILMRPARPVVILFLCKVFLAVLTNLDVFLYLALLESHLDDSLLKFFVFCCGLFVYLFVLLDFLLLPVDVHTQGFDLFFKLEFLLFDLCLIQAFLPLDLVFHPDDLAEIILTFISLVSKDCHLNVQCVFIFDQLINTTSLLVYFELVLIFQVLGVRNGIDTLEEHVQFALDKLVTYFLKTFILF
jgi:hypothetical protein